MHVNVARPERLVRPPELDAAEGRPSTASVSVPLTTPSAALPLRLVRPRFIWEATSRDGRTVTVAREVTDEQIGLAYRIQLSIWSKQMRRVTSVREAQPCDVHRACARLGGAVVSRAG
ncbi:hypothetical protein [Nonomuraea candida]|uniref:hypothetical protein n=1 Tax=Nonomuraea candida TaxID=359159 RepID=UPI0012F87B0E|nr:hypothetical protein [Nonomuraea candida]